MTRRDSSGDGMEAAFRDLPKPRPRTADRIQSVKKAAPRDAVALDIGTVAELRQTLQDAAKAISALAEYCPRAPVYVQADAKAAQKRISAGLKQLPSTKP